jgi:hypothetical protein
MSTKVQLSMEPQRTCPSCGYEFFGAMEFCPVCMLRKGLTGGAESGESSFDSLMISYEMTCLYASRRVQISLTWNTETHRRAIS